MLNSTDSSFIVGANSSNSAIISVLEKHKDDRTQSEIELLVALIKNLTFFKERDIKEKYYPEIVSCLKLKYFKGEQIVFEKGSVGKEFFIIIKGTIKVTAPNKSKFDKIKKCKDEISAMQKSMLSIKSRKDSKISKSINEGAPDESHPHDPEDENEVLIEKLDGVETEGEGNQDDDNNSQLSHSNSQEDVKRSVNVDKERKMSRFNHRDDKRNTVTSDINSEAIDPRDKLRLLELEPDNMVLVKLTNGDSFGELALINNSPRNATIVCDTPC
jgi:CRP-like cAMP-binding protein